jgi:hypothetical protein
MTVFDIVRAWHLDLDLTRRKAFDDDERLRLCAWARQALEWILVDKTADMMKYRLILQQARAVVASSFAHALLQEHRIAANDGWVSYTKFWLGPQAQIGEVEADLAFTETEMEEFADNMYAMAEEHSEREYE